ncbi:MAG: hypothetical protein A2170_15695 [Deltaproteobacteria bacterium RBG_13_53_10]|nr:MAG: hypothetical protein A2170_15695 [Deltaproteobacteria bacterium RBG_13_53_10]
MRLSAFRRRHLRAPGAKGRLDDELSVSAANPRLIEDVGAGGVEAEVGQADAPFDCPGPIVELEVEADDED